MSLRVPEPRTQQALVNTASGPLRLEGAGVCWANQGAMMHLWPGEDEQRRWVTAIWANFTWVPEPQRNEFRLMTSTPFSAETQHPGCRDSQVPQGGSTGMEPSVIRPSRAAGNRSLVNARCFQETRVTGARLPAWLTFRAAASPGTGAEPWPRAPATRAMPQTVKSRMMTFGPRALPANSATMSLATKGGPGGDPPSTSCPEIELASENTASKPLRQSQDTEKP